MNLEPDVAPSPDTAGPISQGGHFGAEAFEMPIAIVVATTGRPRTTRLTIDRLARQTRLPDRVLVIGAAAGDLAELDGAAIATETHIAPRGSCAQRNFGLELLGRAPGLVAFFDDDFLAADTYLEAAARLFHQNPDIVGANGRLIADGANGPGIAFVDAETMLAADRGAGDHTPPLHRRRALYGCNMVVRGEAVGDLRFDENLPLYGWQEDIDFSYRLAASGRLVGCTAMAGVHMGEKSGRTSGRRFGYSQIANPLYLLGKKSIPRDRAWTLMRNNLASNLWRSLRPEAYIDRRGRLAGNLLAMRDLLLGRIHPRRILEFPR